MAVALLAAGWYSVTAFPLQAAPSIALAQQTQAQSAPPRDPRPGDARPANAREVELMNAIKSSPSDPAAYLDAAKLQEARGATSEAEATLMALRQAQPQNLKAYIALAGLYQHTGQFDRAVAMLEQAAALDPANPDGQQILATVYFEKVRSDPALTPTEKATYIQQGIGATDRALDIRSDYVDALVYKNLFLRMQANLETDPSKQQAMLAEADSLRNRALELRNTNGPAMAFAPKGSGGYPPPPPLPPPPPPPSASSDEWAMAALGTGKPPLRVGGNITPPTKTRDVMPAYPDAASAARVQGVVIAELVIDEAGNVAAAHIVRSIPLLDQAALDAIKQWKFTPTLLNGAPVPVLVTVTVNFTLK
jgi:TonB family protein